jgi:hypothetical protein
LADLSHLGPELKSYFLNETDWEGQDRMLKDFNEEVNNDASEYLNAALIIEKCSQENYLIEKLIFLMLHFLYLLF